ncbi:uncharacterized protein B0P05DRAFT_534348 [Gilbertella persicaria]|uniref:uncharacterized protein n=1 Tax=Gilbertella persicaria TaxID=101096 RepID=UPI002220FC0F|nr:uncharacterized protein B0P05DRAFT_534348 [Gilbertella persicaria]KAI8085952.1 hypothetical protein B0P05DRAFT_534348 [Gilbertella persicaria]
MHFLGEAWYRRPLEPKALAYSRGGTAITMTMVFLAFCGYLINQIFTDKPLIQNSLEEIMTDTVTPDVELCVQNSTMHVVKCTAMYYNWTTMDIPDCWTRFFRPGYKNDDTSKCWYFSTNNTYRMATGLTYDNRDALRRFDFYWNIDSLANLSHSTISVPAIAVQLYDPRFSTWNLSTMGDTTYEKETSANIQLGQSRATTYINHTSAIFYYQQKYRAIKPKDASAIIGLTPKYTDVMTLVNFQHNWPLQTNPPPPALNRSLYQGIFSVQLARSTIEVQAEIRQHTILAAVALAGGCYGVLTSLYIMLFGMSRLTPWGLAHHIPAYVSRKKHHVDDDLYIDERNIHYHNNSSKTACPREEQLEDGNQKSQVNRKDSTILVPWFFRASLNGNKTFTAKNNDDSFIRKMVDHQKDEGYKEDAHQLNELVQTTKIDSKVPLSSPELYLLDSNDKADISSHPSLMENTNMSPRTLLGHTESDHLGSSSYVNDFNITFSPAATDADKQEALMQILRREQERSDSLTTRVEELEIILSEYFINTYYLDQIRNRKHLKAITRTSVEEDSLSRMKSRH